jgi:hypothetical protein
MERGVVAKYTKVNKYDSDREGMNNFLDSLGILPLVCTIDEKLLTRQQQTTLTPYILSEKKWIRYVPNTFGKLHLLPKTMR